MNSLVLMLPGASVYQVMRHQKLEKEYKITTTNAEDNLHLSRGPRINQKYKINFTENACKRFYNACNQIDQFQGRGALVSLAKTISAVAIASLCLYSDDAIGAVVATCLAVEGDFQLYYSLFRSNKPRWHVFEANSDKVDFVYVDKVVIPVPRAIYNILPTSMLQLIRE